MDFHFDQLLTVIFTLFAVIDIVGSIPLLIAMKEKSGAIKSLRVTLISGALMILFLFLGKPIKTNAMVKNFGFCNNIRFLLKFFFLKTKGFLGLVFNIASDRGRPFMANF